jgi:hypothetical protein
MLLIMQYLWNLKYELQMQKNVLLKKLLKNFECKWNVFETFESTFWNLEK